MCGIAGIINLDPDQPVDVERLCRMRDVLRHRGVRLLGPRVVALLPGLRHLGAVRREVVERVLDPTRALGVADAVMCGSGRLALELALRTCRIRDGDEVVIPTFCCSAVVPPILAVGATPVLADVGEELNLTVETVDPC